MVYAIHPTIEIVGFLANSHKIMQILLSSYGCCCLFVLFFIPRKELQAYTPRSEEERARQ
jgi:hypothetical protein